MSQELPKADKAARRGGSALERGVRPGSTAARVLACVPAARPGLTAQSISDLACVSPALAHSHLMRLIERGRVARETMRSETTGMPAYGYFVADRPTTKRRPQDDEAFDCLDQEA